jgi:thymidylate synthase (FAD)
MSLLQQKIDVLDKGWVQLDDVMPHPASGRTCDHAIVAAARQSVGGRGKTPDRERIHSMMRRHHTSPFERVTLTFIVRCPIFVARQWMRHRTWSYNELSMRYTALDQVDYYVPDAWRAQSATDKQGSEGSVEYDVGAYREAVERSVACYQTMIEAGMAREMARIVLPVSVYTQFAGTVNAHNLMHFLKLRMSSDAQYEIRLYAITMYVHFFRPLLPWTSEAFEQYVLIGPEYDEVRQYIAAHT